MIKCLKNNNLSLSLTSIGNVAQTSRVLHITTIEALLFSVPCKLHTKKKKNQRYDDNKVFVFRCLFSHIWSGAGSLKHHWRTIWMRFHHRSDEIQLQ